ncbi:helix-turn-helix domain-containing protein [Streptomyces sp. CAU 1734]|uniref:helix-turn-helix domain-containing protein n=1 Tax=Streptomyces sp. CAU 1734 TaxID=3140360 RepID=UPI003260E2EB
MSTSPPPRSGPAAPGPELLGTRLRLLLELLDGDVAAIYEDLGLPGFRPRHAPVLRALAESGPAAIRDIARAAGVTHSAASQTVAGMERDGLVVLRPGADARARIVHPTARAEALLPLLAAETAATAAAATALEAELSFPLGSLIGEALAALERRPMRARIADAAPHLTAPGRRADGGPSRV